MIMGHKLGYFKNLLFIYVMICNIKIEEGCISNAYISAIRGKCWFVTS